MITYSTDTADLLFVGAGKPSGTHPAKWTLKHWAGSPFKDHASDVPGGKDLPRSYLIDGLGRCVDVPEGYSLLSAGTADGVSEEEAGKVVQWFELNGEIGYRNYESSYLSFGYKEAQSSMNSLLRSLNLNPSETVVLFKKKK